MKTYSLGFCFWWDYSKVALIRKNRPSWQKGKLNGVGGHLKENETFVQSMQREWIEESGIPTKEDGWRLVTEIRGQDYVIGVFTYRLCVMDPFPHKINDEPVAWFQTQSIATRPDLVNHLKWLIPLCLDDSIDIPVMVKCK